MSKSESPSGETRVPKSWFYPSFINLYKASGLTGLFTCQFNTKNHGTFADVI